MLIMPKLFGSETSLAKTHIGSGVTDREEAGISLAAQMWAPLKKWPLFGFLCFLNNFINVNSLNLSKSVYPFFLKKK